MSFDRQKLEQQLHNCQVAMRNPDLPQDIRDLYKKAAEHAEVALGLHAAVERKKVWDEVLRKWSKPPSACQKAADRCASPVNVL